MKSIHVLLNKRWIIKKQEPELYFKLKDEYENYKSFFREKLGYPIVINPYLIKVEKTPGTPQAWMGIQSFDSIMEYVFLCLMLMYLEEKEAEEQFILVQVTDYIQNNYPGTDKIDWTIFSQRKSLIKVLRFCSDEGLLIVNDGDENTFSGTGSAEVLYENTGASKYFMKRFSFDISEFKGIEDFIDSEWNYGDTERGVARRHRVYRKLAMIPVVYSDQKDDQDYLYIKNKRSVLENDFERFLDADLHIHKNGALLLMKNDLDIADCFPNRRNITDIVLQLNKLTLEYIKKENLPRDFDDTITISEVRWDILIENCILEYGHGWSKQYREASFNKLKDELLQVMTDFGMLRYSHTNKEILLYPVMAKMIGEYPKDYVPSKEKGKKSPSKEEQNNGTVEN